jgi:hypothetical protein
MDDLTHFQLQLNRPVGSSLTLASPKSVPFPFAFCLWIMIEGRMATLRLLLNREAARALLKNRQVLLKLSCRRREGQYPKTLI